MAQPTNCDGSCDSPRLGHNNRGEHNGEKGCQGRQEEGREEAVVLQEALGVLTASTPFFLPDDFARGETAGSETRTSSIADRRARRQSVRRTLDGRAIHTAKGGIPHGEEGGKEGCQEDGKEEGG